jgi:hypothetical protein
MTSCMQRLFISPHLIDLILLLTLLEAGCLWLWHRRSGRGLGLAALASLLLPGVCLMLALRAVLAGAAWPWMPAALAAALVAHLADLVVRYAR